MRRAGAFAGITAAVALESLACLLYVGRHNGSTALRVMFVLWVLSPFVLLLLLNSYAQRWAEAARSTFHRVALVSLAVPFTVYAVIALGPPRLKPAFAFVVIPPILWLIAAMLVVVCGRMSRARDSGIRT